MSENKKKRIRNIIIAIVVVVILAAAATAIVLLRKDAFGLNSFERNAVIATVGEEKVTYGEFVTSVMNYYGNISTYNMYAMYYGYGKYYDVESEAGMADLKEDMLDQLVYQRVYVALGKELGMTLTAEEQAACVTAGKDAFKSLEEQCLKQAEEAGSADAKNYAQTILRDYFVNTGTTKSRFIKSSEYAALSEAYAKKLSVYYGDERDLKDEELPDVYADYVKTYFEDAYYAGSYKQFLSSMKEGQVDYPYLYIPDTFLFARVITAADKAGADEIEKQLAAGTDFEELLMGDLNTDAFIKTQADQYAIGESDSPFPAEVYTAAAALEVGAYEHVTATVTSTDETTKEEKETLTHYFVKRVEGTTGVVPYEQVKDKIDESLISYVENTYVTEKIQEWTDAKAVVDTAMIAAFDPAA